MLARCLLASSLAAAVALGTGCGGEAVAPAHPAASKPKPKPKPERDRRVARIHDFEFAPRVLRIERGTRVTWINQDEANHTVTFRRRPGDLGNVDPRRRISTRFNRPGRYRYVCVYHPSMVAQVIVDRSE